MEQKKPVAQYYYSEEEWAAWEIESTEEEQPG